MSEITVPDPQDKLYQSYQEELMGMSDDDLLIEFSDTLAPPEEYFVKSLINVTREDMERELLETFSVVLFERSVL